jgi:hypothetical protein
MISDMFFIQIFVQCTLLVYTELPSVAGRIKQIFFARQNIVSVRKNAATSSDLFHYPLSVNHTQKDLKPTENVISIACFKR